MRNVSGVFGVVAGFALACGGTTSTIGDGGMNDGSGSSSGGSGGSSAGSSGGSSGSSSGSGSGGSSGGGGSPCPASPPPSGGMCPMVNLVCEYGTNPNASCDMLFQCQAQGWVDQSTGINCPTGMCPTSFQDVPQGQACSPDGFDCAYPEGQCDCAPRPGPPMVDGGGAVWQCFMPAACPEPRADLGTACPQPGVSCDYGACSGGIAETCMNGVWVQTFVPCPG